MASASATVKDVINDLQTALKELKGGDEDDLGELANKLDAVADRADSAAGRLHKANQALEGQEEQQDEQQPEPEQQPAES